MISNKCPAEIKATTTCNLYRCIKRKKIVFQVKLSKFACSKLCRMFLVPDMFSLRFLWIRQQKNAGSAHAKIGFLAVGIWFTVFWQIWRAAGNIL
jgi:hypothetical protein